MTQTGGLPDVRPATAADAARTIRSVLSRSESYANLSVPPRSVFLIGSCSGPEIPDSTWQDFDVHFLFHDVVVRAEHLHWLRSFLDWTKEMSTATLAVDGVVRDRHWKMTPQEERENIGIHATLLSDADHFRRVQHHPVLSSNMYTRCRVLIGEHPAAIRPVRHPSRFDYVTGVGGICWLIENFMRAVAMHQLDREDRHFAPFIAGYCWNVVGAALFHLRSLRTGKVHGRHEAAIAERDELSTQAQRALTLVEQNRLNVQLDLESEKEVVNAGWLVLAEAAERILGLLGYNLAELDALSQYWAQSQAQTRQEGAQDVLMPMGASAWESVAHALAALDDRPITLAEDPEHWLDEIHTGIPRRKVRLWNSMSLPRRVLSDDFCPTSSACRVFGWELGAQAVLQRINEWMIDGQDSEDLIQVADRLITHIGHFDPTVGPKIASHSERNETIGLSEWRQQVGAYVNRYLDNPVHS